jgi:hypothetical protein
MHKLIDPENAWGKGKLKENPAGNFK